MSYLVHRIPGRVRIKVPTIRYSPGGALLLQGLVEALPGVEKVQCNPVTGSVVVYYDEALLSAERIVEVLKENGHLNAAETSREGRPSGWASETLSVSKTGQFLTKALFNVALDVALKNTPFSFLTVFI